MCCMHTAQSYTPLARAARNRVTKTALNEHIIKSARVYLQQHLGSCRANLHTWKQVVQPREDSHGHGLVLWRSPLKTEAVMLVHLEVHHQTKMLQLSVFDACSCCLRSLWIQLRRLHRKDAQMKQMLSQQQLLASFVCFCFLPPHRVEQWLSRLRCKFARLKLTLSEKLQRQVTRRY